MSLAELDFIPTATNIVFIGPTGVGKSGLATGLLLKALQNGYRALFIKAQDLFDEMYASLADRSSRKLVDRLARVPLLCVDEMGYLNLRPEQCTIVAVVHSMEVTHGDGNVSTETDDSSRPPALAAGVLAGAGDGAGRKRAERGGVLPPAGAA